MHPHCAAAAGIAPPPRTKTSPAVIVVGIFGALILLGVIGGMGKKGGATAGATGKASVVVTAEKLYADYQANEVAADGQYKGATVEVTGTIKSIEKDAFGSIVISISTGAAYMSVDARTTDAAGAAKLAKGQRATMRCTGAGMVLQSPQLRDCTF